MIACLQIPGFATTIERRHDPALAARPVILEAREHVYAVSDEAAHCGVYPGMPLRPVLALCPEAAILPARPAAYAHALSPVLSLLADFGVAVEPEESYGSATCYLDLGELPRAAAVESAIEMGRAVRGESHLPPSVGIATGKFPARIAATSVRPSRARVVDPGAEAALLAPLPVETLPLDGEMARRLHLFGIRTLGQFAALPASAVLTQFGRGGQQLHRLARGQDSRPVRPRVTRPAEQVAHHLDDPIGDRSLLEPIIQGLAASLAQGLQERVMGARTLWLTLHLEDRSRRERRRLLREPLANAETLGRALGALLKQMWVHCGVISLQAIATDLVPLASAARQLSLFGSADKPGERFQQALPGLRDRYGTDRFYRVAPGEREALLLERRFRLQPLEQP
jgi:DNA polymerase IV